MIALEEKNFQSIKTDASLYNGLPTDTGTMCHSAEVTSSTPPSRNARMGRYKITNDKSKQQYDKQRYTPKTIIHISVLEKRIFT